MKKHACIVIYSIILILSIFSFLPMRAQALPDEATQDPTNTYIVAGRWRTPTYAYESDNSYAWTMEQGSWQGYYEYDFDSVLPVDISISKVEVGLEFYCLPIESLRIRISVDDGVSWSGWSNLFTLTSEDILWVDVTAFKSPWLRSYLLDANWKVEVNFLIEGGGGCFHPDTLITMAKTEDGEYEYETIKGLSEKDKILGYNNTQRIVTKYEEHIDANETLFYNITTVDNRSLIVYGSHEIVISPLLKLKGVENLTTQDQLFCQSGVMVNISSIELVYLTEFYNLAVSGDGVGGGLFYAERLLVHNLEKGAWTAYLDWIPTRVTYTTEEVEEEFDCNWIGVNNTISEETTLFSSEWNDLNASEGLSHFLFSTNNTGTWTNDTWSDSWRDDVWADAIKTLNSTEVIIAFKFYINDTSGVEYTSSTCFFPSTIKPYSWFGVTIIIGILSCFMVVIVLTAKK